MPSGISGFETFAMWWVQPSSVRSRATGTPVMTAEKFSMRCRCQPGSRPSVKSSGVGRLPRTPMADGVRWNTYRCFADSASAGTAWMALAPVPMIPTTLSPSWSRCGSSGRATRVAVVPSGAVEGAPAELLHAHDGRELHQVEDPGRDDQVVGADRVTPVGGQDPARARLVPLAQSGRSCGTARRRRGRSAARSRRGAAGSRRRTA